jgi:hypothetical protein
MATITKIFPSGSSNGVPIKVAATATPGTLFHTADATAKDELYIYATNTDTNDRKLTIEFGGATAPDYNIVVTVPAGDTILVVAGVPLSNSLTVKAFGAAANLINLFGYVNRIS